MDRRCDAWEVSLNRSGLTGPVGQPDFSRAWPVSQPDSRRAWPACQPDLDVAAWVWGEQPRKNFIVLVLEWKEPEMGAP